MRRSRLLVGLAVTVVLGVMAGSAYAVVRHRDRLPTVTCRHLLESVDVDTLATVMVADLRSPAFGVDVDGLSLPTRRRVDDARHLLQVAQWPQPDALVCGLPESGALLFVRQADVPLDHCYASAAMCAGEPTERRTCAQVFTKAVTEGHLRDYGCPDPAQPR